eukprot:Phypoly_transcript_23938.p1 GENE.Phypoly_transcript_23938~~Phypoly_transcript_23938.p1  ORF type:complete len:100 (+),score=12.49 Phypoly_transcript_23938:162-461(+)
MGGFSRSSRNISFVVEDGVLYLVAECQGSNGFSTSKVCLNPVFDSSSVSSHLVPDEDFTLLGEGKVQFNTGSCYGQIIDYDECVSNHYGKLIVSDVEAY